jgi:hypothetical protein
MKQTYVLAAVGILLAGLLATAGTVFAQSNQPEPGMMRGGWGRGYASSSASTSSMMRMHNKGPRGQMGGLSQIQGNGQPIVGGTVSSISGATFSITNKSNATYSIDASHATVVKAGATSSVSNIATGDAVLVQGTINGTAVTATSVIDHGAVPVPPQGSGSNAQRGMTGGFFGAIGGFFHNLFGFF